MASLITGALTTIEACGEQLSNRTDHIPFTAETVPEPSVDTRANMGSLNKVTSHFLNCTGHASNIDVQETGKNRFYDLVYDALSEGRQRKQFRNVCLHKVESIATRRSHTHLLDKFAGHADLIVPDQYPHLTNKVGAVVENVAGQLEDQNITGSMQVDQLKDVVRTTRTVGQLLAALQSSGDPRDAEPLFPLFLFGMPRVNTGIDEVWKTLPSRLIAKDRTLDGFKFNETEDLIGGAIGGVVVSATAFFLSRSTTDAIGRSLLAILLVLAGGAYFGFAWEVSPRWLFIELAQTLVLGTVALMGLRSSPYWLAAGWAAHPFWDVGLHLVGPGQSFVPATYPVACVSFDLVVAGYIVAVYRFGLLDDQKSALLS